MTGAKQTRGSKHSDAEDPELSARPRDAAEQLGAYTRDEDGLALEPEDMGRQFLGDAVEQGDFEARFGGDDETLSLTGAGRSDAALTGPHFEADQDVWENTVNLTLQAGGAARARDELAPADPALERDDLEGEGADDEDRDVLDLTQPSVREVSLFDREADLPGEVISPSLLTDDTHHHGKPRGGHAPRR